ncbi:assimilatory sulfite reductase (NADPH) flavoprotein subunit [Croceicoccus naphthovorans]|uniref:Sulfite reductase [NADPH] flavoprotein alpha-component n=1 Tax=Croceicoccus naphthovorans TaxID=1348774 RepID=A0A0G3XD66_9SPHN|nr:assimilatory sulfite reductase (NADPH) flavoprotein subunit [Croceicoccus naphthovorans]AKM09112.1 sulfite reductase [NADPH] flavoprotein alpha-component [Croceicoccus naphthovorans]MBB3991641.1 sulfite reductase (NADPH) flavoprotein alpha-component [Croceicoccus naphthovorans]
MKTNEAPGGPLTPEQWRLVNQLAQSLKPAQAGWLGAYFAGLDAGLRLPSSQAGSFMADVGRKLTILYGTETGNAAELARGLAAAVGAKGIECSLSDMADYKVRQLAQEDDLLIIVSTYGEGDPPQPATGFFEFVEGRKAPKLDGKRFALLALGDSTYEFYCEAGKRLDRRFEELGAERLIPRIDCDIDYEDAAEAWMATIIDKIAAEAGSGASPAAGVSSPTAPATVHDKRNPFSATVIDNIAIVGRGSTKETRHIEFSLEGSGLVYEPGDALGIAASNDPGVVSALIDALALQPDAEFEHKGQAAKLAEALTHRFEITTATPRFLDYWALLSEADALKQLLHEDRSGERSVFLHTHHIIDIVRRFPVADIMPQGLVSALRPLQPRLYSLASSHAAVPEEAHLTVAPVRYDLHDEARCGVVSGLLADRAEPDTVLPVYIQSNPHFRLPGDDAPIIMIGAGTGVAPYRAFLQEREVRGAAGKSWLFFGERNFRSDFLYQTEWQGWLKDGTLGRMDVAFSRDGNEKVYVQQRMKEQSRDIFAWLEEGAHVYVCGDASNLAPDVHEALTDIVASEARTGREAAEDYVRSLQSDHRYQRDVY